MRAREGATALVTLLGHKGDLMLIHFRRDFEPCRPPSSPVSRLRLAPYLEPTTSYVSIVELGHVRDDGADPRRLEREGPASRAPPEFEKAFDAEMEEQRKRVVGRLFLEVPPRRHVCFYPMNKRRGEAEELVRGARRGARRA